LRERFHQVHEVTAVVSRCLLECDAEQE
jgi:hypothetical protein